MNTKTEEKILACVSVADAKGMIDGSIKSNCNCCNTLVWVSKAGQNILKDKNSKIICLDCLAKRDPKDFNKSEIPEEVVKEFFDQLFIDAERDGIFPKNLYFLLKMMFGNAGEKK